MGWVGGEGRRARGLGGGGEGSMGLGVKGGGGEEGEEGSGPTTSNSYFSVYYKDAAPSPKL